MGQQGKMDITGEVERALTWINSAITVPAKGDYTNDDIELRVVRVFDN